MKKIKVLMVIFIIIIAVIGSIFFLNRDIFSKKSDNDFMSIVNYNEKNYEDYLKYYQNNSLIDKQDIVNFINFCVDNNINWEQKNSLINFYKLDDFQLDNIDKYLTYQHKTKSDNYNTIIKIINNNLDEVILKYQEQNVEDIVLSLIEEKYYKKENLTRYVDYYLDQHAKIQNLNINDVITNVNSNLDYGFYDNYEKTDISKDTLMIVNKHYKIDDNYTPDNLVTVEAEHGYPNKIRYDIYQEFKKMYNAAKSDGISIFIASPYRSYYDQKGLYDYYVSTDGVKNADTYSARPGFSEHHTGLAMDLIPEYGLDLDTFENSAGFNWMQENAYKFGFILRYPKDKEYITGYIYEPWHYRYVGVDAAKIIKDENLTFEEYYEYYVK